MGKSTIFYQQGLWGTSVGGKETLTSKESLPDSATHQFKKKAKI